ncbi:MAG: glycosyltransferase family 2 protein [Candidatus Microgenomates bacterium]
MEPITAIIVVKNNPPFIFKTISSIKDLVNQILIIDIGIDKKLIQSLKKIKTIKIIKLKKEVLYVELIRDEIKQMAKTPYVFFLDPDEEISQELKNIIKKNLEKYDYFKIPRKNIIFGKWINHSRWWPDYQIRLFKKDKVIWSKQIHKQPDVNGKEYKIEAKENLSIIHYNYKNLDEYLEKARRYAKAEAKELQSFSFSDAAKKALNEFISRYFAYEGYKDGVYGFILSFLQMFYYFLVYFYYLEFKNFKTNDDIKPEYFFKQGLKETIFWKKDKNLKEKIIRKLL